MMVSAPHIERIPYINLTTYQLISLIGVLCTSHTRTLRCINPDIPFLPPVADAIITITGQSMGPISLAVLRLVNLHTVQLLWS
jgi:hypothetical protein